jgi:hypothetical protein
MTDIDGIPQEIVDEVGIKLDNRLRKFLGTAGTPICTKNV